MKRPVFLYGFLFTALVLVFAALTIHSQTAAAHEGGNVARGAALYDNWPALLGKQAPAGDMPIWARQSTNTRSGPDTWRCVTCHGWDYQGKDGAYGSGSNYTGFVGVYGAGKTLDAKGIADQLGGKRDPQHDFSAYLSSEDVHDLTDFLQTALVDDAQYIDSVSLQVKGGDRAHGQQLYDGVCAECHGVDGAKIRFRFEGTDASLGALAIRDPWRFLHKTRFGTPGTPMAIGYDLNWTAQDGRDVLLYAQGLPSDLKPAPGGPVMEDRPVLPGKTGGPAQNTFTGILTAIGAMIAGLGLNVLIGGALVGILLLMVWAVRSRNNQ